MRRTAVVRGKEQGRATLEQRFHFDAVDAKAIAGVLLTAPLVGDDSVFGNRPGREVGRTAESRSLRGFSPAPGFRFDVDLTQRDEGSFLVRFAQPDREAPYLQGDLLWELDDVADGAVMHEHVNTERALEVIGEPLGGPRPSLRRWLFFRVGHRQVMLGAARNIAALVSRRSE